MASILVLMGSRIFPTARAEPRAMEEPLALSPRPHQMESPQSLPIRLARQWPEVRMDLPNPPRRAAAADTLTPSASVIARRSSLVRRVWLSVLSAGIQTLAISESKPGRTQMMSLSLPV
jgi:hypothetical protein